MKILRLSVLSIVFLTVVGPWVVPLRAQSVLPVHVYRLGFQDDFLYTTNFGELGYGSGSWAYSYCTMGFYDSQVEGTVPLYRFYSSYYGKHFYTTNFNEVGSPYWTYEVVAGYIWPTQQPGTQAIHRYFRWYAGGPVHYYTINNSQESDDLIQNYHYEHEGIIGYAPTASCF